MAELVEEGVSGWRFATGDVHALAAALAEVIEAPGRLDTLYSTPPDLPSVDDQVDAIEDVYRRLSGRGAQR